MSDLRQKAIDEVDTLTGGIVTRETIAYLDKFPHDCGSDAEKMAVLLLPAIEANLRAEQERDEARELLRELVEKLDLCGPAIDRAFAMAGYHGQNYHGPRYGEEIIKARAYVATFTPNAAKPQM